VLRQRLLPAAGGAVLPVWVGHDDVLLPQGVSVVLGFGLLRQSGGSTSGGQRFIFIVIVIYFTVVFAVVGLSIHFVIIEYVIFVI
jgi:hypothetical protein